MMAAARDNGSPEPAEDVRGPDVARALRAPMTYRLTFARDHLRAELAHRETVGEMREFLRAVARDSVRRPLVLIRVQDSKPLFHVERDGLVECLLPIARHPLHRIALVADAPDLQAAHEYLELIARQRGVRVRSFGNELEALAWFRDRRAQLERRLGSERRRHGGPRPSIERRLGERRLGARRQGPPGLK